MMGDQLQDQFNHNQQVYATEIARLDSYEMVFKIGVGIAFLYVIYLFARK